MEFFKIILSSVFSVIILFILTKLMGNRQVSELTMFDYIIGISIGSIAAEMATDIEKPIYGVIAMAVYAFFAIFFSFLTSKSLKARNIIFGKTLVLMNDGKMNKENFKKAHLDLSEFLMQARTAGYYYISDIDTAQMEPNGKISFLPFPHKRPVTAEDLKVVPQPQVKSYNVVSDGIIIESNLQKLNKTEKWLSKELTRKGFDNVSKIFLAVLDENDGLTVFSENS